jgi:hypothetical protein
MTIRHLVSVNATWECECGRVGVPSEIGGALFDFQFVCTSCMDICNKIYHDGGWMDRPVWLDDPSVIVTVRQRQRGGRHARTT